MHVHDRGVRCWPPMHQPRVRNATCMCKGHACTLHFIPIQMSKVQACPLLAWCVLSVTHTCPALHQAEFEGRNLQTWSEQSMDAWRRCTGGQVSIKPLQRITSLGVEHTNHTLLAMPLPASTQRFCRCLSSFSCCWELLVPSAQSRSRQIQALGLVQQGLHM